MSIRRTTIACGRAIQTEKPAVLLISTTRIRQLRNPLHTQTKPQSFQTLARCIPLPHQQRRSFQTSPQYRSTPKYTYSIGASFSAKGARYNPSKHTFNFNPHNSITKRRKDKRTRPESGQDAFFAATIDDSSNIAFGICDGVGGWTDSGVDPADFAHGICDFMAHAARNWEGRSTKSDASNKSMPTARELMQIGYDAVVAEPSIPAGGSTACVGILKNSGEMEIANLGDSGFIHLRLGAVHQYSEAQTHDFNTPYQLSVVPRALQAKNAAFGGVNWQDMPDDADISHHDLKHGDVVILATDGVWDNLTPSDVLRITTRLMVRMEAWLRTENGFKVNDNLDKYLLPDDAEDGADVRMTLQQIIAGGVAAEAKMASINTRLDGPFAREVQRYFPEEGWRGGKVDDICVIVAIVSEEGY